MKILITDDHPEDRYLLESLLRGNGHEVLAAADGAAALAMLQDEDVDLIISDILMPVMDGFQFCRKVKTDEALRAIPFIFYTATYTGPQDEAFALKLGAERFIEKPCEPEKLIAVVNQVMTASRIRPVGAPPASEPVGEEEVLRLYSERLVRKLEQKIQEAEGEVRARQEVEKSLRESEQRLIAAQRLAKLGDFTWDVETGAVTWSAGLLALLQYQPEEITDFAGISARIHHPEDRERIARWLDDCLAAGKEELSPQEYRVIRKDGEILSVRTVGVIRRREERGPVVFATVQDITEAKRAEQERENLQSRLSQVHKMGSVGRLAGGVAHDFNNMLGVIMGHVDLALMKIPPDHPLFENLQEIRRAAERSATLTRQLLTFARKQIAAPRVLDPNETVAAILSMLRRLMGEDIELVWVPGPGGWTIRIDPSQFDQILTNLCVNARDAIAGVGRVVIETDNVVFTAADHARRSEIIPGEYVRLVVTDTGCGMDRETLRNVFEPFFTTKGVGQGTGLGLATIYGIVKQNNGFIEVYSEPGQGATFRIFLPRDTGPAGPVSREVPETDLPQGEETILLVDDDPTLLDANAAMLRGQGYTVFAVSAVGEALRLAREHPGRIALLMTDVVMPELSGRDLAKEVRRLRPAVKVLYMSGFPGGMVAGRGLLEEGVKFLQKPLSLRELAAGVRAALD